MTEEQTTVTQELEQARSKLEHFYLMEEGIREATRHIENAMTKIQILRCSVVADMDKL